MNGYSSPVVVILSLHILRFQICMSFFQVSYSVLLVHLSIPLAISCYDYYFGMLLLLLRNITCLIYGRICLQKYYLKNIFTVFGPFLLSTCVKESWSSQTWILRFVLNCSGLIDCLGMLGWKKLISSQSKKKLENFLLSQLEDYNPGDNLSESSGENCPPGRGQNRVIEIFETKGHTSK